MSNLIDIQNSLLVVIDVQHRLASAMPEDKRNQLLKQVSVLLQASQTLSVPTLVTEQYPKGLGPTEAELAEVLAENTPIIEKTCFSCLNSPSFIEKLNATGRKQIILTGMEAHICVLQTAMECQAAGLQVFVVEDGICSRKQDNKDNAIHRLRQAGVVVTNTESVLFEWLRDAQHSEFRTLSKLII